ncbi:Hint domain-containing protein [Jannaschia aquimarina]|uniref:Hedgehog/Intein (Hint) domain-containing protein n=1 Tax=Jannaschia aquimarina TaxID=935700 RepID=A0A0D1EI02_9RHOB|nr:Hint domain-containing protein [Jannaschia aquimarina]KIT16521.1 hypothetical protein jaqu_17490 [Jannaschia aquimarina]SNT06578.1 Hint domain-containing protein [Jannaschia aquimarina]
MSGTGARAHVISTRQMRVDGQVPSARSAVPEGAVWRWSGTELRLDDRTDALPLPLPDDLGELRRRCRRSVGKLARARNEQPPVTQADDAAPDDPDDARIVLALGPHRWTAIPVTRAGDALWVFDETPPAETDLLVVRAPEPARARRTSGKAPICFTAGTLIATPDGPLPVEELLPGDRVVTRDDGPRTVLWVGTRTVADFAMAARPELRPVRIRANAFGHRAPQPDLVVSPGHRLLIGGDASRALWGEQEVLVRAQDLIDDRRILVDHAARSVTYVHLLLASHHVLRANGIWAESFHPGDADLSHLTPADRSALLEMAPGIDADPHLYGPHARRCLTAGELAILSHAAPPRLS